MTCYIDIGITKTPMKMCSDETLLFAAIAHKEGGKTGWARGTEVTEREYRIFHERFEEGWTSVVAYICNQSDLRFFVISGPTYYLIFCINDLPLGKYRWN